MGNGVIKSYSDYKKLSDDEKGLFTFERLSLIPTIQQDIKSSKSWKIKVIGFASGISAILGFVSGKIFEFLQ